MIGATAWTDLRIPIKPASNSTLKLATGRLPDRLPEVLLKRPTSAPLKSGGRRRQSSGPWRHRLGDRRRPGSGARAVSIDCHGSRGSRRRIDIDRCGGPTSCNFDRIVLHHRDITSLGTTASRQSGRWRMTVPVFIVCISRQIRRLVMHVGPCDALEDRAMDD